MRSHLLAPLSVRGFAAFNLAAISDATTKTMIAVLTLVAALMVVVGLIRAWVGRLRPQVVIEDVAPNEGLPSSSASGLSPQLRQVVRQALQQQSEAARTSVSETLEQDIEGRLLRASGSVQVKAITTGLRSTTEDSLAVLAAGVRAVAAKEAEGLLAALNAALPTQRGWAIRAFPVLRDTGSEATVGMAVELAQLGHPPDAVATFWSGSNEMQSVESDQARDAAGSSIHRLLDPTALWIATRLVSRQLAQSNAPMRWRLLARRKLRQELAGLQMQLAGQLALYAMRRQPKFEREFAKQALADLADSARLLPEYFMPHSIKGAVHVRLGWSYRRSAEMQNAANEFSMGVRSYDEATQKLENASDANPNKREAALERVRVWRTKCRLLSGDPGQLVVARQELAELCGMTGTTSRDLYNGACLFAVAIGCPDIPSDEKLLLTGRAWFLLGRALLVGGAKGPWMLAMTDIELEALEERDRRRFCDKLKARLPWETKLDHEGEISLVRDSMLAIGISAPEGI